jgi:hypothetical protein
MKGLIKNEQPNNQASKKGYQELKNTKKKKKKKRKKKERGKKLEERNIFAYRGFCFNS